MLRLRRKFTLPNLAFLPLLGIFVVLFFHWRDCVRTNNNQQQLDRDQYDLQGHENDPENNAKNSRCEPDASQIARYKGFVNFTLDIQNFISYRHCRKYPMLLDVPEKCGDGSYYSENVFLLLVIKSHPTHFNRRQVLRKTWARESQLDGVWVKRVFIMGTHSRGFEKKHKNELLQIEQSKHNDILQWDIQEAFYNISLKQVLFLDWMETKCKQVKFMLNAEDDVFANTDKIVTHLRGIGKENDGSKHLFMGNLIMNAPVERFRNSKYFVSKEIYSSEKYPPYCAGGGYLLSRHTASVILQTSKSLAIFPMDDVYMGMCLVKAGLEPVGHTGVKTNEWSIPVGKSKHDPCYVKDLFLIHDYSPTDTFLMWHSVREDGLKCAVEKVKQAPADIAQHAS